MLVINVLQNIAMAEGLKEVPFEHKYQPFEHQLNINKPPNQLTNKPTNQQTNRPPNQQTNKPPTNKPINQYINRPTMNCHDACILSSELAPRSMPANFFLFVLHGRFV